MTAGFEKDPYPGKPKILFVGLAESTHTREWIDLLSEAELNVRLFALPSGCPPEEWWVRTYITSLCDQKNSVTRKNLYSGILGTLVYSFYILSDLGPILKTEFVQKIFHLFFNWSAFFNRLRWQGGSSTPEAMLAEVVCQWNPDIIHTLGLFDNQGGMFYYKVRKAYQLEG